MSDDYEYRAYTIHTKFAEMLFFLGAISIDTGCHLIIHMSRKVYERERNESNV